MKWGVNSRWLRDQMIAAGYTGSKIQGWAALGKWHSYAVCYDHLLPSDGYSISRRLMLGGAVQKQPTAFASLAEAKAACERWEERGQP